MPRRLLGGVVEDERRSQREEDRRDAQRQHPALRPKARVGGRADVTSLHEDLDERHHDGSEERGPPDRPGRRPKELPDLFESVPPGLADGDRGIHLHGTSDGSAFAGSVWLWMMFLIRSGATPALWSCSS